MGFAAIAQSVGTVVEPTGVVASRIEAQSELLHAFFRNLLMIIDSLHERVFSQL